jgi:amino acid transporter
MSDVKVDGLPQTVTSHDQPVREFGLWSAFALAFSDVSPIVGIYSVFAISLTTAGPGFLWALPVVLVGQLLVTLVFGELVSKYPLQGSVYAWSRELVGVRYAWFTNWIYMWGLTLVLSVLALSASGYLLGAVGINGPSNTQTVAVALLVLAVGSLFNMLGGSFLKVLLYVSLSCEMLASLGIGTVLLIHHVNPLSTIFSTSGTGTGLHWLAGPFLGVVSFVGFSFVGFEAAGSIAQEVREARGVLPTAITLSLIACGALVTYACLGIALALPNLSAVMAGKVSDPIASTLELNLGNGVGRALLVVLSVGFTASMIAVQTAVTRSIWSAARDGALPGGAILGKLSGPENLPRYAIALTAIIAGALLFISTSKLYTLLLSFANDGFFLAYAMPVLAFVYIKFSGKWVPGAFSLGKWSKPVTLVTAAWIVFEAINIAWPRHANPQWYLNWGVIIMIGVLGVLGLVVSAYVFRSNVPGLPAMTAEEGG